MPFLLFLPRYFPRENGNYALFEASNSYYNLRGGGANLACNLIVGKVSIKSTGAPYDKVTLSRVAHIPYHNVKGIKTHYKDHFHALVLENFTKIRDTTFPAKLHKQHNRIKGECNQITFSY